ncbi:MAG: glycosyltransferase [Paracoccaceae bacterium]
MAALRVDIGLFAQNEAAAIVPMLAHLAAQDVVTAGYDVRVHVLCNGCVDDTVSRAQFAAPEGFRVHDLPDGGKSRTWNQFVHHLARKDADVLVFCDTGIRWPDSGCIVRLVDGLMARPDLHVLNSEPVKDIAVEGPQSMVQRLIAASAGGLDDWHTSICGQFYAMPGAAARRYILPIGLPVEDGFLHAMVVTDRFTAADDYARIDGLEGAWHIYPSEQTVAGLIRHQTRLVVGSAINAAVFRHLKAEGFERISRELSRAAADEDWLPGVLRLRLPRLPYAYVPFHFAFKRVGRRLPKQSLPRRVLLKILGVGFDLIVYLNAQMKMARGVGAGHW